MNEQRIIKLRKLGDRLLFGLSHFIVAHGLHSSYLPIVRSFHTAFTCIVKTIKGHYYSASSTRRCICRHTVHSIELIIGWFVRISEITAGSSLGIEEIDISIDYVPIDVHDKIWGISRPNS